MQISRGRLPIRGQTIYQTHVYSELSAAASLSGILVSKLAGAGLITEREREKYAACFEEALRNAIVHGNREDPKTLVHAVLFRGDTEWGLVVEDQGSGFDRSRLPDPHAPEFALSSQGRGVQLMLHVMDRVEFHNGGSTLLIAKDFDILELPAEPTRMPEASSSVRVSERDGITIASPVIAGPEDGEIDRAFSALHRIASRLPAGPIVLDLARVAYLNSNGLGRLAGFVKTCHRRDQTVYCKGLNPDLAQLFAAMRLDTALRLHDDPFSPGSPVGHDAPAADVT